MLHHWFIPDSTSLHRKMLEKDNPSVHKNQGLYGLLVKDVSPQTLNNQ